MRTLLKPNEPVALWAISVDPAADSKGFSEKIAKDGQGPINFPLQSDPESRTIDAYGLRDPRYAKIRRDGIPSPTTYVIDRAGRVIVPVACEEVTQFKNGRARVKRGGQWISIDRTGKPAK